MRTPPSAPEPERVGYKRELFHSFHQVQIALHLHVAVRVGPSIRRDVNLDRTRFRAELFPQPPISGSYIDQVHSARYRVDVPGDVKVSVISAPAARDIGGGEP